MTTKRGSFRHSFALKSKQSLLSQNVEYNESRFRDTESIDGERRCLYCSSLIDMVTSLWKSLQELAVKTWKFGHSNPRNIIFSAKVGLALVIIAVMAFLKVPADINKYAIWAILTVVLVFEFTIGATLNKGFNRGLGTLLAGGLAMSVAELSIRSGNWEETVIVSSIFVAGEDFHNMVVKNFMTVETSLEDCVTEYLQSGDHPLHKGCMSAVESTNTEDALEGFAVWEPPHGRYKKFKYPWKNYVKVSGALRHCSFMVLALHGCVHSEIQAPPERRQIFRTELQRVGSEGAKVLRLLGNKVKKMEKLVPGEDILLEVHEATDKLQKKVDQRSYLLVNADHWEIGTRPQTRMDVNKDENSMYNTLSRSWDDGIPDKGNMFRRHLSLPEPPLLVSEVHNEEESKTYESASAMSLATFISLLIEFVARLQHLVILFEELSEKAEFREPTEEVEVFGLWSRLSRCFK
ncbi:hypothetical protein GIB67_036862 [Kingdonia uniflora]|uniref:Uncharacterized protein n=1 Tax=Kingdonia uniflora TaxID=39325 RepID=A0A7J7LWY1_9MAGN|nr:hypothetical protein GIB67_036862 [Kingdonia uniflora]